MSELLKFRSESCNKIGQCVKKKEWNADLETKLVVIVCIMTLHTILITQCGPWATQVKMP